MYNFKTECCKCPPNEGQRIGWWSDAEGKWLVGRASLKELPEFRKASAVWIVGPAGVKTLKLWYECHLKVMGRPRTQPPKPETTSPSIPATPAQTRFCPPPRKSQLCARIEELEDELNFMHKTMATCLQDKKAAEAALETIRQNMAKLQAEAKKMQDAYAEQNQVYNGIRLKLKPCEDALSAEQNLRKQNLKELAEANATLKQALDARKGADSRMADLERYYQAAQGKCKEAMDKLYVAEAKLKEPLPYKFKPGQHVAVKTGAIFPKQGIRLGRVASVMLQDAVEPVYQLEKHDITHWEHDLLSTEALQKWLHDQALQLVDYIK